MKTLMPEPCVSNAAQLSERHLPEGEFPKINRQEPYIKSSITKFSA